MNLKGKVAVVAGATGGIGNQISQALAEEEVELVLIARKETELKNLQDEIAKSGGKASYFTSDLTDSSVYSRLVDRIEEKFKQVDILFHCAGIGVYKKLPEISYDEWQKSFQLNVDTVFLLTQKLLPLLEKSEKAYVLAMGSGMGKIGLSGRAPYCSSKFALRGLMLSLVKEYKNTNINFVLLTLGSVMTPFGPLTIEQKKQKEEKGKKYLDPKWLAHYIVTKIKHDTLEDEVSVYPKHYFEESKKNKR